MAKPTSSRSLRGASARPDHRDTSEERPVERRVSGLSIYPLKGARGIELLRSELLAAGLRHDRRFMLVDEAGMFLSQRSHPRLALVEVSLHRNAMKIGVGTPGGGETSVPLAPEGAPIRVKVWSSRVSAVEVPGEASALLSEHLRIRCKLVYMPTDRVRRVDGRYGARGDRVGFADAFPVLVASEASLADLNASLAPPVPMDRFRPNVVVRGGDAYEEERFRRVRVGDVVLRLPKRCSRCVVTTIDQRSGMASKEPLRTLARTRTFRGRVTFAMNAIPDAEGTIAVGDPVTYLEPRAARRA